MLVVVDNCDNKGYLFELIMITFGKVLPHRCTSPEIHDTAAFKTPHQRGWNGSVDAATVGKRPLKPAVLRPLAPSCGHKHEASVLEVDAGVGAQTAP